MAAARRMAAVRALLVLAVGTQASILFTKEPYSQDALHGRGAILRCEVKEPADVEFQWLQNGLPVQDTEQRFKEGSNLQFAAVDRHRDAGVFQCLARNVLSGEEARSANASFNIKWIETGSVVLKQPASVAEIQPSSTVVLRCHIDGHPRPTWQWFRDGSPLPEGRGTYSVSSKERTLTLQSAGPDDNGLYYCCARSAVGFVCSRNNFTLSVVDESFPQAVIVPQDLIVTKNEEAVFDCQFAAVPPPTQEWLFEDNPISNRSKITVFANGSLLITQVRARSTGVYKCVGRGQRGKTLVLKATLRLAEIEDVAPFSPKVLTANQGHRVSCPAPQGVPMPQVWWERNQERVPTAGRVYQEAEQLIFTSITETDAGIYMCHAANKAGEKKQELSVTVATVPKWVEMPKDSQLEESKPGYLHCLSKASLKPTVTWYRNGVSISEDSRFEISENGTLRINNVEVYDGTMYKRVSSTPAGSIEGYARVHVLEKLKFTPPPQPLQCMEFDKEVAVSCSATGREKPTIQWTKTDGSSLPSHVSHNAGILSFHKVSRSDSGNYTCIASNRPQGEIRATVQLVVAVFVTFKLEPEPTTVYQGHTAMFQCQAEGDPVPHIQWKGKDKILDPGKLLPRIQIMPNGSLVIYDVTTEDSGKYTCIAGNSCNIKHREAFLYVVDKPAAEEDEGPGSHTPYKMIQTIGLSVGAAVAYIIIVLGLMFYCKKRRKAKRLKKHPEGEEPEMECLNVPLESERFNLSMALQRVFAMDFLRISALLTPDLSKAASTPLNPLSFQCGFVKLRIDLLQAFSQLICTCNSLKTSPPPAIATTIAMTSGNELQRCGRISNQMKHSMEEFRNLATRYGDLYQSSFDADSATLRNVELQQQSCLLISHAIEALILDPESASFQECSSNGTAHVESEYERRMMSVFNHVLEEVESLNRKYAPVSYLLALSPSPRNPAEPIAVQNNQQLALKVEGVVQHGSKPGLFRKIQSVCLNVSSVLQSKSGQDYKIPIDNMTNEMEQRVEPHNDYFSTQFLLNFVILGTHNITVESSVIDSNGIVWKTGPKTTIFVKSLEDPYSQQVRLQQQQGQPPSQQQQQQRTAYSRF